VARQPIEVHLADQRVLMGIRRYGGQHFGERHRNLGNITLNPGRHVKSEVRSQKSEVRNKLTPAICF